MWGRKGHRTSNSLFGQSLGSLRIVFGHLPYVFIRPLVIIYLGGLCADVHGLGTTRVTQMLSSILTQRIFLFSAWAIKCYKCSPDFQSLTSANKKDCSNPTDILNCSNSSLANLSNSCISLSATLTHPDVAHDIQSTSRIAELNQNVLNSTKRVVGIWRPMLTQHVPRSRLAT